jgi:hypothetical protein
MPLLRALTDVDVPGAESERAGHRLLLDLEGRTRQIEVHVILAGLPATLGPPCAERDLALALVISRAAAPASKLSTP